MRSVVLRRRLFSRVSVLLATVGLLVLGVAVQSSQAQPTSGDHLWNFRQNADDRFHSNEAWLRPWRGSTEDGWGCWVGGYSYELAWGDNSTIGNSDGSFTVSRSRDYQFHAWTYVYVEVATTITFTGGGDCVPRVFLNCGFDAPREFPASLALIEGWNRIDVTGYNQNDGYTFSCGGLAGLVDIMNTGEFELNQPPVAVCGGPYLANEGSAVLFDGSGSSDPDGDPLQYRWDFDDDGTWDTEWSSDPTASYAWGDNRTGTVRLNVSDGEFDDADAAGVIIDNVAPTARIDSMSQPSPAMILPNQTVTFAGGFGDTGWLDTHTCTWVFGDGASTAGTVVEENSAPDATGTSSVQHAYSSPDTYSVTLTVTDDDLAVVTTSTWTVTVLTLPEMVQPLDDYIQALPDSAFDKQPANRRSWFERRLEAAAEAIADGQYTRAITELQHMRSRADGSLGGNASDDWVTDPTAQQQICVMIDDCIAYLQSL